MRPDEIRHALSRRPFLPLQVLTSDGERYQIPRPDAAWVTPGGTYLIVETRDGSAALLDSELIAGLTFGDNPD